MLPDGYLYGIDIDTVILFFSLFDKVGSIDDTQYIFFHTLLCTKKKNAQTNLKKGKKKIAYTFAGKWSTLRNYPNYPTTASPPQHTFSHYFG